MHMDGFEKRLEQELARILDPIVMTPAPPRSRGWRDGRRGRLRIFQGGLQGGLSEGGPASLEMPRVVPVVAPMAITVSANLP